MSVSSEEKKLLKKIKYAPKHKPDEIKMPSKVPMIDVDKLIPYPNNVKIHTHQQIAKICASIDTDGFWTNPVIVDGDNEIIAGHGRRLAAIHYGIKKVPHIKLANISKEKANALRIADNKVAEGEIDTAMLEDELRILAEFGVDMIGVFDERELDFMLDDLGELDFEEFADDIPEQVLSRAKETSEAIENNELGTVSLREIFGTSTVSTGDARALRLYLAKLQDEYECDSIQALIEHAISEVQDEVHS